MGRFEGRTSAETHAQKPTQRNFDRRGPDGAVRRHLRRPVRLSDDQDGPSELHERALDRARQMGRVRQFRASLERPAVLDCCLEHLLFCGSFGHPRHAGGVIGRPWREPAQGLASEPCAGGVLPALYPSRVGGRPDLGLDVRQGLRRRAIRHRPIQRRPAPRRVPDRSAVHSGRRLYHRLVVPRVQRAPIHRRPAQHFERNLRSRESRRRRPVDDLPAHHLAAHLARDGARLHDPAHPAIQDFRPGLPARHAARSDDGDGPVHLQAGLPDEQRRAGVSGFGDPFPADHHPVGAAISAPADAGER